MVPHLVLALSGVLAEPPPPPPPDTRTRTTVALAIGIAIDAVSFAIGAATLGSDSLASDQARSSRIRP